MARTNSFEGGSNGTTITTGNSGGASGDAFDNAPAPGTSATMTFSTAQAAHGSVSMSTSSGGTSTTAYAGYTLASVSSDFVRAYYRLTSLPSAQQVVMRYLSGGSQSLRVNVKTDGAIEVRNAANGVITNGTTTATVSAGAWFRIELSITFSATVGAITLRLYLSPDSTSITETLTMTNAALTATSNEVRFGIGAGTANAVQCWCDDVAIEGATWHGPAVRSITPTGIAVAAAVGTPALAQSFSVTPTGIAVPAALGSPTIAQALTVIPDGLAVPLDLGTPTLAQPMAVVPDGIPVATALGSPALAQPMAVTPASIAVPVTLGSPAVATTGGTVTRPNTGTVSRPTAGTVTRPDTGIVERP